MITRRRGFLCRIAAVIVSLGVKMNKFEITYRIIVLGESVVTVPKMQIVESETLETAVHVFKAEMDALNQRVKISSVVDVT